MHHSNDRSHPARRAAPLCRGSVLLARDVIEDPNFKSSIVLICLYNDETTFGLVCNHPSHMPLHEIFSIPPHLRNFRRTIYIGGPVQQDSLQILQITPQPVKQAYLVAPGLYLGGEWESLEQILTSDQKTTRLFLGYAGWAPGQLEREIELGAWDVFQVDLLKLFAAPDENINLADTQKIALFLNDIQQQADQAPRLRQSNVQPDH